MVQNPGGLILNHTHIQASKGAKVPAVHDVRASVPRLCRRPWESPRVCWLRPGRMCVLFLRVAAVDRCFVVVRFQGLHTEVNV